MHTSRLQTVDVSVATIRCQYQRVVSPQVNKFEQDSSEDNKMPVAGGGALYSEVQCIMGNGHMKPAPDEQTDENITFPQLRLQTIITMHF